MFPRISSPYVVARREFNNLLRAWAMMLTIVAVLGLSPAAAAASVHILMMGDSITAGYGLGSDQTLPARLEAALRAKGHDIRVINAGVSGDTSAGGRARIQWSLGGTPKPDAAIVALGANDGLRGLAPEQMRENLDAIITAFKRAGLPVALAGMKAPRNLGPDYVREYEAVFPALAAKHNVPLYPFLLDGVATEPALNQSDGIHPNEQGVARIVEGLLPVAENLAARVKARAGGG